MRLIMWALIIVTSLWTAETVAQEECAVDDDCTGGQYCYEISKMCVDYIECSRFNRQESVQPSRHANQCGKCLEGYSAELITHVPNGEAEFCKKVNGNGAEQNNTSIWIGGILFAIVIAIIILWMMHATIRFKFPCQYRPDAETELPVTLPMIKNGNGIAPSAPTEFTNNNKYNEAEETNPLSTIREYRTNFTVESSRSVQAHAFHPPDNVRTDPTYNPGDNQMVQTFSPPDDEETNPSDWTPGPLTGGTIPAQPFAAIAEEVQNNASNTVACPSPSHSQEGQQTGQNNSSSSNSGGFRYNNANGNTRNNGSMPPQLQVYQCVQFINQGSNGS